MARHDLPVAGAVVVAASVEAMAYYDYYTAGGGAYVSNAPEPSRPSPSPPAPAAPSEPPAPSEPAVPTTSVKALLRTSTLGSPSGSNGNGTNGHGAPPPG